MEDMDLVETLGINSDDRLSVKREMTGLAGKRADAPACRRIGQEGEDYAAEYLRNRFDYGRGRGAGFYRSQDPGAGSFSGSALCRGQT